MHSSNTIQPKNVPDMADVLPGTPEEANNTRRSISPSPTNRIISTHDGRIQNNGVSQKLQDKEPILISSLSSLSSSDIEAASDKAPPSSSEDVDELPDWDNSDPRWGNPPTTSSGHPVIVRAKFLIGQLQVQTCF